MAAIIAATVGSFLNLGIPMLYNAVTKDRQQDVISMRLQLNYIQAFCEDHCRSGAATCKLLEVYLKDMEGLAYEIEDFIDCFLSKFKPRDRKFPGSIPGRAWRFAMRMMIPSSIQIDWKIRELNERSAAAGERFKRYADTIKDAQINRKAAPTPSQVASHISMEDAVKELLQLLLRKRSESEKKKLKVISIVGYGTLGNTHLVHKVYNNNQVRNEFHVRARVNAAGKILRQILEEIQQQLPRRKNGAVTSNVDDHKGKSAVEHQKDGRYLILIDNVDIKELANVIKHCDNEEQDICVVATTDYTKAIHCKCSSPTPDSSTTTQYLEIGELTNTTNINEIERLEKKLQDVLVSNYDKSLSSLDFEQCLLYLCMFPHDHLVRSNLLIMRYLAEGIVFSQQKKHGEGKLCNPQKFLKILTDHNVVQPIQVSKNGEVKRCQPHVMMLNHISGQSKSKNFFALLCGSTAIHALDADQKNPIRRLSLHPISDETDTLSLPKAEALAVLRTLVVFHTGSLDIVSQLSNYELLRVLDLKKCAVLTNEHVKKICDLLLLKYLSLGEGIDEIPREIAKLEWLQTLDMMRTQTVYVPVEVMELPRLKHLLGKFQLFKCDITKKKLKELLSTTSNLERFSGFVIDDSKEFERLMSRMVKLSKVKIWCDKKNWTDGDSLSTAIKTFSKKSHNLSLDGQKKGSLSIDCKVCPKKILESLSESSRLTSLKLHGDLTPFLGFTVNPSMQEISVAGIEELCLSGTNLRGDEILRVVKLFSALTYLKLVEDDLGPLEIPKGCLHSLKRLCLVGVHILREITIQSGALLCLVSLHMLFGKQENPSATKITSLKHLKEIGLHSGVAQDIKEDWQSQASQHENKPKLVFIQSPEHSAA
ncbi:hypothetical protein ACQ4PT_015665 [Festuca glaucescens]